MRQNSGHFLVMFTLLSICSRVGRVVTFGKKLLPFADKLKIRYFYYTLSKVVTSLLVYIINKYFGPDLSE